jgi:protein lin-54
MHPSAAASSSTRRAPPAIAAVDEDDEPRASCNCKTSQCIQQCCQCFGNQWFCSDACRCASCYNVEAKAAFVEERSELILKSKPKGARGCTCRKSKCKKNYCDCFKVSEGNHGSFLAA